MAKLAILKGATSVLVRVFIQDSSSTTGAGLTGLVFNTASLVCYRARDDDGNAGGTAITLATATKGTWATGGFVEKDATNMPGVYEFGIPNAALATGSRSVLIMFKGATNMAPLPLEIALTGFDDQSVTDGGLSKLTSLTFTGANKVDASVRDWVGDTIPARSVTGVPKVDVADWLGSAPDALSSGKIPADLKLWLASAPNALSQGKVDGATVIRANTAAAGSSSSITLDAGASATDTLYRGEFVTILSGTGAGQTRLISSYTGSTQVATIAPNWGTAPDNTSVFLITPSGGVDVQRWGNASIATPNVTGVPKVDVVDWLGSAPSALVSGDVPANTKQIAGAAVSTSTAQLGVNAVNIAGSAAALDANNLLKVDVEDVRGGVVNSLISGRVDANAQVVGTGAIVAGSFASGAIDSSALNATAASKVWTSPSCTEPTAVPAASPTMAAAISWLLTLSRNKVNQTASTQTLYADDGSTSISTAAVSDDGTTFTKGKNA